jgi:hypothetical protein
MTTPEPAPTARNIYIEAPDDEGILQSYEVDAEPLGEDLYRIVDVLPLCAFHEDLQFHDVVELTPFATDMFTLRAVRQRGGWRRFDFVISRAILDSTALQDVEERVDAADGFCVVDFESLVAIFLPPGSTYDPTEDIETACKGHAGPAQP